MKRLNNKFWTLLTILKLAILKKKKPESRWMRLLQNSIAGLGVMSYVHRRQIINCTKKKANYKLYEKYDLKKVLHPWTLFLKTVYFLKKKTKPKQTNKQNKKTKQKQNKTNKTKNETKTKQFWI